MSNNNWELLRAALDKLSASTQPIFLTPLKPDNTQKKKFLLQGKSFFALKAYVMTGKSFPNSDEAFDNQISKKAFGRLEALDGQVHAETQTAVVKIGSSCSTFYDDHLYRIVGAGTLAVTWSESTYRNLVNSEGSLHEKLMVLSDPKYKTSQDKDQEFEDALNGSHLVLSLLRDDAQKASKKAEDLLVALSKFRDTTNDVIPLVKNLTQLYSTGPPRYGDKPYLQYLNQDYAAASALVDKKLDEYNATFDEWKTFTGLAIGVGVSFGWFPVFGWVPLAFLSHKANTLHDSWERLMKEYNTLKDSNDQELKLITWVTQMLKQFQDIASKIQGAVDAVTVLNEMFLDQMLCYGDISKGLEHMELIVDAKDATTRQSYISTKIKETADSLQELSIVGRGFIEAIAREDTTPLTKA